MTWLLLLLYIPALWLLLHIMEWDARGRTPFSYMVLLLYALTIAATGPVVIFTYALIHSPPSCTCEMVKNHECVQK